MSWQNSNNPSQRPPNGRRLDSRSDDADEYPPLGLISAQSLSNMASNPAPLPRMIAVARQRLTSSNRDRINSILGDSPYTTRRWTPPPGETAQQRQAQNRPRPNLPPSRFDIAPPMSASPVSTSPLGDNLVSQSHVNRITSLEHLDRTLDEANTHLRALLDMTTANSVSRQLLPINLTPSYTPTIRAHDFTYDNQRNKRRKVDADRYTHDVPSFHYGHYGQVEAGNLEMEMVSCDGGSFSNELSYVAENILKDDNSVYCTKGNRCNIVLRHRGSTPFALSELIIRAPKSMNYSHPVREGMVFISMEQDAALQRTVEYQIQYPSSSTSTASSSATAAARDRVTFTNTDPRTRFNREPQQTLSISHNQDGTLTTHAGRSYIYGPPASTDTRAPHMPHEFTTNQPDFRISTDFSDDDDDAAAGGGGVSGGGFNSLGAPPPAVPVSILRRPPPNRIGTLPFENEDESDSELESGYITNAFLTENTIRRLRRTDSDTAVRRAASTNLVEVDFEDIANSSTSTSGQQQHSPALAEAWDAHVHATHEALRAVGGAGGSLLAPHARFHIEKKKRKCTIRFDPPVFGRFILLKMWSPQHDPGSNIDIQSVLTRGFAGSRFYPAVTMR